MLQGSRSDFNKIKISIIEDSYIHREWLKMELESDSLFLIRYENELAGFLIVDKKGSESGIDFNMA